MMKDMAPRGKSGKFSKNYWLRKRSDCERKKHLKTWKKIYRLSTAHCCLLLLVVAVYSHPSGSLSVLISS